jgi:formate/nitrite transporter FocA (FNT family)
MISPAGAKMAAMWMPIMLFFYMVFEHLNCKHVLSVFDDYGGDFTFTTDME